MPGGPPADDDDLRVRWVELYADAVVVHWIVAVDLCEEPPARGEERLMRDTWGFDATDDRGRALTDQDGRAELRRLGTRRALVGRSRFSPGVTPGAGELRFRSRYGSEHLTSVELPT